MPDATHYTYRVAWSVEDGEHVATVAEFPSLSWLAPTRLKHSRVSPMSCVTCSPIWLYPVSRSPGVVGTHLLRQVRGACPQSSPSPCREAAEQHVSLNRLVSDRLARA